MKLILSQNKVNPISRMSCAQSLVFLVLVASDCGYAPIVFTAYPLAAHKFGTLGYEYSSRVAKALLVSVYLTSLFQA